MSGETNELVGRAQGGDEQAYEELFARVATRLLVYLRIQMGPRLQQAAEPFDLVQETYLAAHRAFPAFRAQGEGSFTAWLYRIADNRLRDQADRQNAVKRRALEEAARGSQVLARLRAETAGPGTRSAEHEERQALVAAIETLEPREREALLLRFFHELTLEAIAERLEVSEPTVRRLLARGQLRLGRQLRALS